MTTVDNNAFDQAAIDSLLLSIADMATSVNSVGKTAKDFSRAVGKTLRAVERQGIERQTSIPMDQDSINLRSINVAQRARPVKRRPVLAGATKATGLVPATPSREPRFMCPEHKERLIFSKLNQVWECPTPGCMKKKSPMMDRTDTTLIKTTPSVVGRLDEDGDVHWYLSFPEENIIVEMPFSKTVLAVYPGNCTLEFGPDLLSVFGTDGKPFPDGPLGLPETNGVRWVSGRDED